MKAIYKALIAVGEQIAKNTVPGGALIDDAVRGVIDHTKSTDEAILDTAEGAIKAIEAFKEADIADERMFRTGVSLVEQGFHLIKSSLKTK